MFDNVKYRIYDVSDIDVGSIFNTKKKILVKVSSSKIIDSI